MSNVGMMMIIMMNKKRYGSGRDIIWGLITVIIGKK